MIPAAPNCWLQYQIRTWKYPRWVVERLEEGELGSNPRFIISSRYDDGFKLYYEQYCARGDMENWIKDQQLCLFADRTSSTQGWTQPVAADPVRVCLHAIRAIANPLEEDTLPTHECQQSETQTDQGWRNHHSQHPAYQRIRVLMSDSYPYKDELSALVRRLVPD